MDDRGTTGARADAIELLTADHREVEELHKRIEQALSTGDGQVATEATEKLVRELSIHAAIEEQIFYPELRDEVEGGDEMAEHSLAEHQRIKEMLTKLDGAAPTDEGFATTVNELMSVISDHVREEEGEMFPALRRRIDQERLVQLGDVLAMARQAAPTHPHPKAPATPPGNILLGPLVAAADRVRDALREVRSGRRH